MKDYDFDLFKAKQENGKLAVASIVHEKKPLKKIKLH